MDYKQFITSIFGSIKVATEDDNSFIVILPTKYRFADNCTRFKITTVDNNVIISDRGNTLSYLKDIFVDLEKHDKEIKNICKINDIEIKNGAFEKNLSNLNNLERDFFNFVNTMYLLANLGELEEQDEF